MRNPTISYLAVSALCLMACSPDPEQASVSVALNGGALIPAGLRQDAACTAAFPAPRPDMEIRYEILSGDGQLVPVSIVDKVVSVDGAMVRIDQRMETAGTGKGSSVMPYERESIVFWRSSGAPGEARRDYQYDEADLAMRLGALKPGASLTTGVSESSHFQRGGKRTVNGSHSVTFLGCGELTVAGRREPAKVFKVTSIGRMYRANAAPADRDSVAETQNVIWVSERVGWVLKDVTADGQVMAQEILHQAS